MRVLVWSGTFWPRIGGIEVLCAALLPALRERGYEFTVVTSHYYDDGLPDEEQYLGIPVHRFPFLSALADGNIDAMMETRQRVAKLKRTFAPDLIHLHVVGPGELFHLLTAGAHPAPLLATLHRNLPGHGTEADTIVGRTLHDADWVSCVSESVLAQARGRVPAITSRSSVIYNGLEVPVLPPEPPPAGPPRLLCVGRLVPEKGFDLALRALAALVDRFPTVRLTIAGDGPARSELERLAAELALTDHVDFLGWVAPDQVSALLSATTVVVVPSRWPEPFGLVALEAAASARPVVAARIGGLPEVVVHRQTGLLFDAEDSGALAEAIGSVLHDPESAARMGQAARRRAVQEFPLERCVDAYDELYRMLSAPGGPATRAPGVQELRRDARPTNARHGERVEA